MNIRLISASFGIVTGLSAFALPVFASAPNAGQYGAGFMPSPILAPQNTTIASIPRESYGAGFNNAPTLTVGDNANLHLSTSNYGAGFVGSPLLQGSTTIGTVYSANYGAGFVGSPNLIATPGRLRHGHYGAGFFQSPRPWYGYGWFR